MYKKEKFLYRGNSNQMESFLCVFGIDNIQVSDDIITIQTILISFLIGY